MADDAVDDLDATPSKQTSSRMDVYISLTCYSNLHLGGIIALTPNNAIDLKPKKRGNTGGLSAIKEISDELSQLLQCGKHMARTAIVKSLWEYIKTNNLQNPNDKREILLDYKMKAVFGVDTFTVRTSK